MTSQVSIVKCRDYEPAAVFAAVARSVDLMGGIAKFVKPKSKVLVKPNLLTAQEPHFGITTHPEVVRAVIKILKKIDCQVYVGDSPSAWGRQLEKVDEVYQRTGIKDVCAQEGASLVSFENQRWNGKFPLTSWYYECDHLINIAKFKTHQLTLLTGAIKNLYGLIPGTYKIELHKNNFKPRNFSLMLVDLFQEVRPALNIIDGIVAMEGDGPGSSGKLRNTDLILSGADAVAVDSVLAMIMGVDSYSVLTNKIAAARGLGMADIKDIIILGEDLKECIGFPFMLPSSSMARKIAIPLLSVISKFVRYYPYTVRANCTKCLACVQVCPMKVVELKNDRIKYNYSGCISCFCCQESCPSNAIMLKKSFLARILG